MIFDKVVKASMGEPGCLEAKHTIRGSDSLTREVSEN